MIINIYCLECIYTCTSMTLMFILLTYTISKHVPLENKSKSIILYILHKEPTVLSSF